MTAKNTNISKTGKKRQSPCSIRFTAAELAHLESLCLEFGLSRSALIKSRLFDPQGLRRARHPVADAKELVRLQARAASLTDALKAHETRVADDPEIRALIEASYAEIAEIRTALLKALGRQT